MPEKEEEKRARFSDDVRLRASLLHERSEYLKEFTNFPGNKIVFQNSFCDDGSKIVTFSTTKKLFGIVGGDSLKTRVVVKHDTGTSCFETDLSIRRHS